MKINFNLSDVNNRTFIEDMVRRHPALQSVQNEVAAAGNALTDCFAAGHKLLVCGNGGSAADAEHIVGELMKGFENRRNLDARWKALFTAVDPDRGEHLAAKLQSALPAIALNAHTSLITAVANDTDPSLIFAQQVMGYGLPGDILLALTTSGNSQNIIDAAITAKAKGMSVIGITGLTGGRLKAYCDIVINVPETRTFMVQELQLPVYHTLALIVENHFYGDIKQ